MNKARRKLLAELSDRLEEIQEQLAQIQDAEQDYFDNMPEAIQGGEKGDAVQCAIDLLGEAECAVVEAVEKILESMGGV